MSMPKCGIDAFLVASIVVLEICCAIVYHTYVSCQEIWRIIVRTRLHVLHGTITPIDVDASATSSICFKHIDADDAAANCCIHHREKRTR